MRPSPSSSSRMREISSAASPIRRSAALSLTARLGPSAAPAEDARAPASSQSAPQCSSASAARSTTSSKMRQQRLGGVLGGARGGLRRARRRTEASAPNRTVSSTLGEQHEPDRRSREVAVGARPPPAAPTDRTRPPRTPAGCCDSISLTSASLGTRSPVASPHAGDLLGRSARRRSIQTALRGSPGGWVRIMGRRYSSPSGARGRAAASRVSGRSEIVARLGPVVLVGLRLVRPDGAGLRLILRRNVGRHLRRGISAPGARTSSGRDFIS